MNRTIKEAILKRYHYNTHDQLRQHPDDFVAAYNFGRRPKTLKDLTPYAAIVANTVMRTRRNATGPFSGSSSKCGDQFTGQATRLAG